MRKNFRASETQRWGFNLINYHQKDFFPFRDNIYAQFLLIFLKHYAFLI